MTSPEIDPPVSGARTVADRLARTGAARALLRLAARPTRRASRIARRVSAPVRAKCTNTLVAIWRGLPLPQPAKRRVRRVAAFRLFSVRCSPDHLLCGGQYGKSAITFGHQIGDLTWSSRRVSESVYADFLRRFGDQNRSISDSEMLDSAYGMFSRQCIERFGSYFGASTDDDLLELFREFLGHFKQSSVAREREGRSLDGARVIVAPVAQSKYFQIIDGHHRSAIAAVRGESFVRVRVERQTRETALQNHLSSMTWLGGGKKLYQPIDAPELAGWPTVRKCTDRRDKMVAFLSERDLLPPKGNSYIDLAACYGWFVSEMRRMGFDSTGVELDPQAPLLAEAAYELPRNALVTGDVVSYLTSCARRWDVVSCFSLLHHFIMGNGSSTAKQLLHLLDGATKRVLFLDTGQDHERWFSERLKGWNTEKVRDFLMHETSFNEVIDLGPDEDAQAPFEHQYGRHLFACYRSPSE